MVLANTCLILCIITLCQMIIEDMGIYKASVFTPLRLAIVTSSIGLLLIVNQCFFPLSTFFLF